jgi:hypothetical protein
MKSEQAVLPNPCLEEEEEKEDRTGWKLAKTTPSSEKHMASFLLGISRRLIYRFSNRTKKYQHSLLFEAS